VGIDELRSLSSLLFGHRYRLELLAVLAHAGTGEGICLKTMADRFEAPPSVYHPPLKSLVSAGLVVRMGRTRSDPRVLYAPSESSVWTGLQAMVEGLEVELDFRDVVHARTEAAR